MQKQPRTRENVSDSGLQLSGEKILQVSRLPAFLEEKLGLKEFFKTRLSWKKALDFCRVLALFHGRFLNLRRAVLIFNSQRNENFLSEFKARFYLDFLEKILLVRRLFP